MRTRRNRIITRAAIGAMAILAVVGCYREPDPRSGIGSLGQALASVPTPTAPFDFAKLPTPTPTLSATVSSGTAATVDSQFEWSSDPTFAAGVTTATVAGVASGGTASYALTAAQALTNGSTSYWRARSADAGTAGWSAYSPVRSFTVDTAASSPTWHQSTRWQFDAVPSANFSGTRTASAAGGEVVLAYNPTPVLSDTFESGNLTAWTLSSNINGSTLNISNVASAGAPSGSRVMKYVDTDGTTASPTANRSWGPALGRGAVDWWERTDGETPRFSVYFVKGVNITFGPATLWRGGNVKYVNAVNVATDFSPPVPYTANAWTRYRVEYLDKGPYDFYVNGTLVGAGLPMQSDGSPTGVILHDDGQAGTSIADRQIDDVYVYAGATSATYRGPPIAYADRPAGANVWGDAIWTEVEPVAGSTVTVQVEYLSGGSWVLVSDAYLPNNSTGFAAGPVSLIGVDPSIHGVIRLKATLARSAAGNATPELRDWGVGWAQMPFCYGDEFGGTSLKPKWHWLDNGLSQAPLAYDVGTTVAGQLHVEARDGTDFFPDAPNNGHLLYQAVTGDFQVTARFTNSPTVNYQNAGIFVFQDPLNYLGAYRLYCSACGGVQFRTNAKVAGVTSLGTASALTGASYCVRVTRTGGTFVAERSADCTAFTVDRTYTPATAYPSTVLLGISVNEGNSAATTFASDSDYLRKTGETAGSTCLDSYPTGTISLTAAPSSMIANGSNLSTVTSGVILDTFGTPVPDGTLVTTTLATPSFGATLVATDLLPGLPGVQLATTSGVISFLVQAGTTAGLLTVQARATNGDASGSVAITLTSGPPTSLVKVSGDSQTGTAGAPLAAPFVVRVTDASANPVSGFTITFAVATGGGSIAPASVLTAADGTASATGTLGTTAGTSNNTWTASATGLTGSPQTFTASATAGAAAALVKVSGDLQTGIVGTTLASPFVVRVTDSYGNPVSGTTVTFAMASGGGSIIPTSAISAADGSANATGTLGTTAGTNNNTYTATATGLTGSPQTFTASATAGSATALVKVSGDSQTGTVGNALASPFVVRVNDLYGNPVSGTTVTFAVATGGGSILPTSALSSAAGTASATGTLGTTAGTNNNTYTASAAGLTGSPQTFTASATAGAATALVKVSGDNQTGTVGTTLASPFVARVNDSYGNPVSGTTVTFAVATGGGSIVPISAVTLSDGTASATGTLGTVAGTNNNTYSATAAGLTGSPQTFTASATAGAATALVKLSGDNQTGTVGSTLASPFAVRVNDSFGNPVSGTAVTFAMVSGGGSILPTSAVSAANGAATATGTLGTTPGTNNNTYTASATGLAGSPQTFTASATAGAASALVKVSGDNQTGTVGTALASPFVVRVNDSFGNPVSGTPVTFAMASGGGSILPTSVLSAANGTASATGTLGTTAGTNNNTYTAGATGLTGSPQTFTASANPGAATALVKVSGDSQSGTVGSILASPFVVQVADSFGNGVGGVAVSWAATSGGGSIAPTSSTTDGAGKTQATGTLGTAAGTNTYTASSGTLTGSPQTFTAAGQAAAAFQLVKVSGDAQTATVAATLALPLKVKTSDSFGNAVSGVTVTFAMASGGGSVSPTFALTDAVGEASTVATLGTVAGSNSFTASAAVTTGSPQTFSATGTAAAPAALVKVSGDNQTGIVGTALASPFVVRVNDPYGNPVSGTTVTFAVVGGGGSILPTSAVSSAVGTASATGTLGTAAGTSNNTYTASATGLTGSPQTFTASATAGAAAALVKLSGDNQTGPVATTLANPFVVRVIDPYGNAVSGTTVTFAMVGGGGSITPPSAVTAADGNASATGTLGTTAGTSNNTYTASATGLTGSPRVFTASATSGAAVALVKVSGDNQTGTVGSTLASPFVVRVNDSYGNPVSGTTVTFAMASGGGSIAPPSPISSADGTASATGSVGTTAGTNNNTYTASAAGLTGSPQTFTASASAGAAAALVKLSGDNQTGTVGSALASPFVVRVNDSYGNAVSGTTVTFAMATGGGSILPTSAVSSAVGAASATGTLGTAAGTNTYTATSGTLTGSPQTFTAFATAGAAAALVKVSGDNQTGVVNTTLFQPFVVEVDDAFGNPVSGVTVTFAVLAGGGSIAPVSAVTGALGRGQAGAALGTSAGTGNNRYSAAVTGLSGSPQTFAASAAAGAAATLGKVSGDNQSGTVGTALPAPFVVRVADAYANPVAGVSVAFAAATGGGSIAPPSDLSAADGTARATGTLGTVAGANTFTASTAGLGGSPQTFTATGAAGAASVLVKVSGDNQIGAAGSALAAPFVVRVDDGWGNPVSGVTVDFGAVSGGGSVLPASTPTDAAGAARATAQLGTLAGAASYSAAAAGLSGSPQIFSAQAAAGPADRVSLSAIPGRFAAGASTSLSAAVQDAYGNTRTSFTGPVGFAVSAGGNGTFSPPSPVPASAGVARTSFSATRAGTYALVASSPGLTDGTARVDVDPAPAAAVEVTGFPSPTTAGATGAFTVTAVDRFGNRVPSYAGSVTFTSIDVAATLPPGAGFTAGDAGQKTFSAALRTAGTQSITADDAAATLTGTQSGIEVLPAPAFSFAVSGIPSPIDVGTPADVRVEALDAYGNRVTGYVGTVAFSSSDAAATLPGPTAFTAAAAGQRTFAAGVRFGTGGTHRVTVRDSADAAITGAQTGIVVIDDAPPRIARDANSRAAVGAPYVYNAVGAITLLSGARPMSFDRCDGPVGFRVEPTGGAVRWTPAAAGTANLCVLAKNAYGEDRYAFPVEVVVRSATGVAARFTATPPDGPATLVVAFDASASSADPSALPLYFRWRFGDGSPPGYGTKIEHRYVMPGGYRPRLLARDAYGAAGEADAAIDVFDRAGNRPPRARIVASATRGRDALTVDLSCECAAGTQPLVATAWDLGDGRQSGQSAPTVTYAPGRYHVQLTVVDAAGLAAWDKVEIAVANADREPPECLAAADPPAGEAPLSTTFLGFASSSSGSVVRQVWTFGAGDAVESASVPRQFDVPGARAGEFLVEDDAGLRCTDRVTVTALAAGGVAPPRIVSVPSTSAHCGDPYAYSESGAAVAQGDAPIGWAAGADVPDGFAVESDTGQVSWTPRADQAGSRRLSLLATNAAGSDGQEFDVEVACADSVRLAWGCGCGARGGAAGSALAVAALLAKARRRRRVPPSPCRAP